MYKCEKCNWEGKRPATMGIAGLKVKVCQDCLSGAIIKIQTKSKTMK
jgi:ribosome-binding protein aMBF1 (putative translation factor)